MAIIAVNRLAKSYGDTVAVQDISFEVAQGEIFAVVGPNGAGKTTLIECVEGLRVPTRGSVLVDGQEPRRAGLKLRQKIGIQLQEAALPDRLKVWEALDLYASFYAHPADPKALLARLGLASQEQKVFAHLSGGQKQRLFIALALINNPELLFLDELSTGLDPQARRAMWDLLREIRREGKTVFLTTHSMEEAQCLCDRVAIIDHGQIKALDSPTNLVKSINAEHCVAVRMKSPFSREGMAQLPGVTRVESAGSQLLIYGRGERFDVELVNWLSESKMDYADLQVTTPNLEDVFLQLTGREMRE